MVRRPQLLKEVAGGKRELHRPEVPGHPEQVQLGHRVREPVQKLERVHDDLAQGREQQLEELRHKELDQEH